MKIGQMVPNYARWWRGDEIWATCEKGKEMGLSSLFFVDHIIVTPEQYIGMGNGYMDIWTAMTYVAAVTNAQGWKPTLGQCVCVIPYRPPIQQAKVAATIDSLSGGRLMIGAGSGYMYDEFETLGIPYEERGARTDEYLKAMIELWTHPVATFHGKYVNFENKTISVRPSQQPHPPILVGARGKRPFRRIAEFCQGYVPGAGGAQRDLPESHPFHGRPPYGPKTLEEDLKEINKLWKEYGREGKPYVAVAPKYVHLTTKRSEASGSVSRGVVVGDIPYTPTFPKMHVQDLVNEIRAYADVGADEFVIHPPSYKYGGASNQEVLLNQMEMIAEHVLPKVPKG